MKTFSDAEVRLHAGILASYGSKEAKITEFGLRPWRTRRRKAIAEAPPTEGSASPTTAKPRKPRRRRAG